MIYHHIVPLDPAQRAELAGHAPVKAPGVFAWNDSPESLGLCGLWCEGVVGIHESLRDLPAGTLFFRESSTRKPRPVGGDLHPFDRAKPHLPAAGAA